MQELIIFAVTGLGIGVIHASIALGIVTTYRGTGVINFATGAMAAWSAYVYDELRRTGDMVFPIVLVPSRYHSGSPVAFIPAIALAMLSSILIGLATHFLIFRPLRMAPVLAKVVASVGLMLTLQSLIIIHFDASARRVLPIVPAENVSIFGTNVPRDRLWLTAILLVVTICLGLFYRYTRFGLAIRAGAESERSVALCGFSPQTLAGATWLLSTMVVSLMVILAVPMSILTPTQFTLAIVPALSAALVGRLSSIPLTVAAGLLLGSVQSIMQFYTNRSWWPGWARNGAVDAVPFLVVVVALFVVGKNLPSRGAARLDALPEVVRPKNRVAVIVPLVTAGTVLMVVTQGSYRFGVMTSLIMSTITLSFFVLTGMVGQISLAQAAFAGAGGFALSKLGHDLGIPFPVAPVLAACVAGLLGILIGLPALRIRGAQLAVVTIATAVAIERFVFRNPSMTNLKGNPIPDPSFFGLDLGVREGRDIARLPFGLLVLVVVTLLYIGVANLARSATGRRFLAVRSNERATAAVGVSVQQTKLIAFALSSALAGMGGAFLGYSRSQLTSDSFSTLVGLSLLAFAYLGGITSLSGALVAGMFAPLGLNFVIGNRLFDLSIETYSLLGGLGLIITAIQNPVGIAGAIRGEVAKRRSKRDASHGLPASTTPPLQLARSDDSRALELRRLHRDRPPGDTLLTTSDLRVQFGGLTALAGVDLAVRRGEIVGLIGPNGAGKTTFIDAVTGFVPSTGRIELGGRSIDGMPPHRRASTGMTRTWQSLELFGDLSVLENLAVASQSWSLRSTLRDFVQPSRDDNLDHIREQLLLLGLDALADAKPSELSLGQQKLVGVARALASGPELVLLDEPAAGLDTRETAAFADSVYSIAAQGTSILLIDHDMGLVLDVCDRIYVLDFGCLIAEGTPSEIRNSQVVIEAYLGKAGAEPVEAAT